MTIVKWRAGRIHTGWALFFATRFTCKMTFPEQVDFARERVLFRQNVFTVGHHALHFPGILWRAAAKKLPGRNLGHFRDSLAANHPFPISNQYIGGYSKLEETESEVGGE